MSDVHRLSQVHVVSAAGEIFEEYSVMFISVVLNLCNCMCYVLSVH